MVYVDLDGVLADFDAHHFALFGERPCKKADNVQWHRINEVPNFYAALPPMPDMAQLWGHVARYDPIVLTGIPRSIPEAAQNKRDWVAKHLGSKVHVITCMSHSKWTFCQPGDVLIDDWEKYRDRWEKAGGTWVTHTSAEDTITQLKAIGL